MSVREEIAEDLVRVIRDIDRPRIGFVSRDPTVVNELANSQYPCVLVTLGREERLDETMKPSKTRSGRLEITINGYTQSVNIDQSRNALIEAIEDKLELDRTRNSNAKNSRLLSIEIIETAPPYGAFTMTYEVFYTYTRGNS